MKKQTDFTQQKNTLAKKCFHTYSSKYIKKVFGNFPKTFLAKLNEDFYCSSIAWFTSSLIILIAPTGPPISSLAAEIGRPITR